MSEPSPVGDSKVPERCQHRADERVTGADRIDDLDRAGSDIHGAIGRVDGHTPADETRSVDTVRLRAANPLPALQNS